jgi:deazaflavin-dependent oxidoreductase (nitroreductase family)
LVSALEAKIMNPLMKLFLAGNVSIFRATGGKIGSEMFGGQVLLLTAKGSKSGKDRTVPVMYFEDGANRVVVASAGGSPSHPAWFRNLSRDPNVTVETKGKRYQARAEVATGDERARIWTKIVAAQPRFAGYMKKAEGREIPVVVLRDTSIDGH